MIVPRVTGLVVDDFAGRGAWPERDAAAVVLHQAADVLVRHSRALEGTGVFLDVQGVSSREICLQGNDLRRARVPYRLDPEVKPEAVRTKECNPFRIAPKSLSPRQCPFHRQSTPQGSGSEP